MKGTSCVTQLSCVKPVTYVKNAASNLPVGAKLQNFWQTWLNLGAGPKIVRSLRFFNRLFLVPKRNTKWRPILDLSNVNPFLKVEKFKMETPETIRTSFQQRDWVTSIDFKDAYFHIPIQEQSRKYLRFHVQGQTYQFKALPFGLSTAPMGFTVVAKEVKLMAIHKGIRIHQYLGDWLVRARSHQVCLQNTQDLIRMCQDLGWLVNLDKSELDPKQVFDFVIYQFNLRSGQVRTGPDAEPSNKTIQTLLSLLTCSVRQFMSLIGSANPHRETSSPWWTAYETHTVASKKKVPESLEKVIPIPRSLHPHLQWWLEESNVLQGQPLHPIKHDLQIFRRIKRRVGRSLKQAHCKRDLVTSRKQPVYKLSGTKSSLSSLKRVPRPLLTQDSSCGNRQHYCSVIHKQGRRHEVGSTMCPTVENLDLVYQETSDSQSPTHTRPIECGSRQAIHTRPDHQNRMVSPSRGLRNNMQQVTPATDLFAMRFNNKLPQIVSPVPVPWPLQWIH